MTNLINRLKLSILFILIISNHLQSQEFEFITQHEGSSTVISSYGNYTYFNTRSKIRILENTNNTFSIVKNLNLGSNYYNDINIDSDKMFVSTSGSGTLIYDLSDPLNPDLLSSAGNSISTIIHDTLLINTIENHINIFNIADINQPLYLSNILYDMNQNNTYALANNILYGFTQSGYSGPQYLMGYNISNPENPSLSVLLQISPDYQNPWPDYMQIVNNNFFVAFNDTIKIYDVADPDTIIYQTQFPVSGEVHSFKIEDNKAYIAMGNIGISIFDVSNIFEPELLGEHSQDGYFEDYKISGDYILSSLGTKGIRIADKSDLQNIEDVYEYTLADAVFSVHFRNNLGYFGMKESGLQIIDITNILNPVKYGNIEGLTNLDHIESIPDYLFCMKDADTVLHIVDISDSQNPQKVSEIVASNNWINDFEYNQDRLFVLDGTESIEVYDLSIPGSPALLTTIQETANQLAVKDSLLFLCDINDDSESILKLFIINSNNEITLHDEIILGEASTYYPRQIEIDYPHIYVMVSHGIVALEIDTNNLMNHFDDIIWEDFLSMNMAYDDSFIYISCYGQNSQIFIIDKNNPYSLSVHQIISVWCRDLAPIGTNFCLASANGGYSFYGHDFVGIEETTSSNTQLNHYNYPNPCSDFTTFHFDLSKNKGAKLEIYNLSGQKLMDFDITNKNELILETNSFTAGVYLYKISTNEISYIKKFIITR